MVEKKYKDTSIGKLPSEWKCEELREHLQLLTDYDANGSFADMANNVNTRWGFGYAWYVRATDLEQKSSLNMVRYADENTYDFLSKSSLNGGEVLLAKRGEIGKVYFFQMKTKYATLGPNLYLLKLKNTITPKFVYEYFCSEIGQEKLRGINASTSLGAIYKEDVKSLLIPVPSINEQKAIVEVLSSIDKLIFSLEKLIEKKKANKQGVMQKLLTGKTRLSGFSDDWKKLKLGDILSVGHGQNQKRIENENGKYKILATGGCIGYTDEFLWNKPSVLIGRKGTIDKPQYVDEPFWTIDTLFYTKIKEGYNARCLFYYMQMIDWMNYNEASGVPSLSAKIIEKIEICIPKYDEQCEIAKTIDSMDSEIVTLESKLSKYCQIKQGMMQELLTGRIRLL